MVRLVEQMTDVHKTLFLCEKKSRRLRHASEASDRNYLAVTAHPVPIAERPGAGASHPRKTLQNRVFLQILAAEHAALVERIAPVVWCDSPHSGGANRPGTSGTGVTASRLAGSCRLPAAKGRLRPRRASRTTPGASATRPEPAAPGNSAGNRRESHAVHPDRG